MSWKNDWPDYQPRPKTKKLTKEEKEKILVTLERAIQNSPVLSALNYRVRALRGRFYIERVYSDESYMLITRVTPLAESDKLLLERQTGQNSWQQVKNGKELALSRYLVNDPDDHFHSLGQLNTSIKKAIAQKCTHLKLKQDGLTFYYPDLVQKCTVQEVLYHHFGLPIPVIAQPRQWYSYRRIPQIVEIKNMEAILVYFSSYSINSGSFGGACLYTQHNGEWGAFTIRPNQSDSIESTLTWLEKRKWKPW